MKANLSTAAVSHTHTMKVLLIRLFLGLTLALLFQTSFAVDIGKLYEVSIKVESEQNESQLIKKAFTQVLVKVSGRSDIILAPAYELILSKAESSISQFRYDHKTRAPLDSTDAAASDKKAKEAQPVTEKWFWASFNPSVINALLAQAQIPVWGKNRPASILWFSQEIQGKRFLQSQYEAPDVYKVFNKQADARGISLIFPFVDLQDQSTISASDLWGNFNDTILLASKRYRAQSTLTSRLFQEPGGLWVSQWSLLLLGEVYSWEIRDKQLERVLQLGIDELADKLAQQFTQQAQDDNSRGVLVQINNVIDYKGFLELDDYLRHLATIKSLTLVQMAKDSLIYRINYVSTQKALIQELRQDELLNPVERSPVNYSAQDDNKPYQSVILDDLDKPNKPIAKPASIREQALNSLDKHGSKADSTTDKVQLDAVQEPVPVIRKPLQADLQYWFSG